MTLAVPRLCARTILNGFDSMFAEWQNITLGARSRFERADWHAVQAAARERLTIYRGRVNNTAGHLHTIAGEHLHDRLLWRDAKAVYADLSAGHSNAEIAQTFFNSCYCYVFGHEKVSGLNAFVLDDQPLPQASYRNVLVRYPYRGSLPKLVRGILDDYALSLPWEDLDRDVAAIADAAQRRLLPALPFVVGETRIEMLDAVLYRNKAAYLIGRAVFGDLSRPFVLPLLNNECGGIYVDTALFDPDDLSILFSFSRSYFMVDIPVPSQYVRFLKQLMPNKEVFELYTGLGFVKHAKTEFYRTAVAHTRASEDQYVIAPGIRGMVMLVFTLPSFDYVYKVIRDRFTSPKSVTREQVREKYRFAKTAERAGRMADTQEFTNLAFARSRFPEALLAELQSACGSQVELRGHALILRHVYIERRMIPLNLYVQQVGEAELASVMDEYGNAIKQLAAANIFPGDMLLKNFGVTRHGRVVLYDYDELCPLTDCEFRELPEAENPEEALAAQPWFDVGPNDVFPEQFHLFFAGNPLARRLFDERHSDIYEPAFWRDLQQQIRDGVVHDVLPYRRNRRFPRTPPDY